MSDTGTDAAALDAAVDVAPVDARANAMCSTTYRPECLPEPFPDWAHCESPRLLGAGESLAMQDSAEGGYGDCAQAGTGAGGPRLYYSVAIPPASRVRVNVVPLRRQPGSMEMENAVVRVLSDCYASGVEDAIRGGAVSQGKAAVCLDNATTTERRVLVVVGQYSGEVNCLPLVFEISAQIQPLDEACLPYDPV